MLPGNLPTADVLTVMGFMDLTNGPLRSSDQDQASDSKRCGLSTDWFPSLANASKIIMPLRRCEVPQSVMLLRCSPLYLLSMLQLVSLSGIAAADIYSNSYPQPPTRETATESTPTFGAGYPRNERAMFLDVQSSVMMKPISLSYLRDNLGKVSSLLDFVRLFTDSEIGDDHMNHLISRAVRSTSDLKNHQSLMNHHVRDQRSSDDLEAFQAALFHIAESEAETCSKWKCHHPTPYVLSVRDPHDGSRMFIPRCVVLHRCMNSSGCCRDGDHECVPKSMNIVTKSFLVVNRQASNDEEVAFDANMATTISFVNHTECECRRKPKIPKCTKACPRHFRLTQEGIQCICDCFPLAGVDPWSCESIKDGVMPLSADGLECIQNGKCYSPTCAEGEFDVAKGFCPLSNDYALPAFLFENPAERLHYREHLHNFDFSGPHGQVVSATSDPLISPTPSSKSGDVFQKNIDELNNEESLLSRDNNVRSTAVWESAETQDSSKTQFSTQNASDISESSNVPIVQDNSTLSVATNDDPSKTEADLSSPTSANDDPSKSGADLSSPTSANDDPTKTEADLSSPTSANELQSSTYPSYDYEHAEDDDDDQYGDVYSEFLSHDSTEEQSVLDSTSQVKAVPAQTAQETVSQVSVASTVLPAKVVQTQDTNNIMGSSQNMLNDMDSQLSSITGDGQDVASSHDDDDDNDDDDDDDEYINKDVSSQNDYKESSLKDYHTDSSNKGSKDLLSEDYFKDSLSTEYYKDSSFEDHYKDSLSNDYVTDSSFEDNQKDSLSDDHDEDSLVEDYSKDSANNDDHKGSSVEDYRTDSTLGDHHKDSLNKDHNQESRSKNPHKDSQNKRHLKDSSSKDQFREDLVRQIALNNNLRHKFHVDSHFPETVQSDGILEEANIYNKDIHSGYRSTVPSIAPSYSSVSSTKLPKKNLSLKLSSPSSKMSSLSAESSTPLSKLSLLFSLSVNPEVQNIETSTKTSQTDEQHLKTSTEKSFLKRLYNHRDATSDDSGKDGG